MNKEPLIQAIEQYIAQQADAITEDLKQLVRIPSYRSDAEAGALYGRGCREVLDQSLRLFEREGFHGRADKDGQYGIARSEHGKKTIGIFSHSDVVSPGTGWLITEPFSPKVVGDCMFGRGVVDDKAAIVETLYAFKAIKELDLPINSTLMAYIGCNEETGMADIDAFNASEMMPDISFVPDCRYPLCIGERSGFYFDVVTETKLEGIRRIWNDDGSSNVIPISTKAALPYSKTLESKIRALAQGLEDVVVNVENAEIVIWAKGKPKHASIPEGSKNAARTICGILKQCDELPEETKRFLRFCDENMEDWNGEKLGIDSTDPHFGRIHKANLGLFWDGVTISLPFAVKHGTATDIDSLIEKARVVLGKQGFGMKILQRIEGFYIDQNDPATVLICDAYHKATGHEGKTYVSAANTYAHKLRNAYAIGVDVPYIGCDVDLPSGHGRLHECDECINIKSVLEATKTMITMILAADKALEMPSTTNH